MARAEANYIPLNGSKLEYSETENGTYTRIHGLKSIPDIGGTPNIIDTTDLDNEEYETGIQGLKPMQQYDFDFNLELPDANSNIKKVSDMEDGKKAYYFKITYKSGVIVSFKSKVKTTIKGGQSEELEGFIMHLAPIGEPKRTIPTGEV